MFAVLILASREDAASAAGRAQAQQFGKESPPGRSKQGGLEDGAAQAKQRGPIVATGLSASCAGRAAAASLASTAGCSFGILARRESPRPWLYLAPQKSEMESAAGAER